MPLASTDLLADDDQLQKYDIHPGDEVFVVGYPFGFEGNNAGFPVLGSGWLASYPLLPSRTAQCFLLAYNSLPGDSGGPVFFNQFNRFFSGSIQLGSNVNLFIGLMSGTTEATEVLKGAFSEYRQKYPIGIAIIVPASFIKDTIAMLPPPTDEHAVSAHTATPITQAIPQPSVTVCAASSPKPASTETVSCQ